MRNTPLRSPEMYQKYQNCPKSTECIFCTERSNRRYNFIYWYVVPNDFPYDNVATTHDMLVSKRHYSHEREMATAEYAELCIIKEQLQHQYEAFVLNFPAAQSVPGHLHYHLLTFKTV